MIPSRFIFSPLFITSVLELLGLLRDIHNEAKNVYTVNVNWRTSEDVYLPPCGGKRNKTQDSGKQTVKDSCCILLLLPTGDVTAKQNSNHVTHADLLRGREGKKNKKNKTPPQIHFALCDRPSPVPGLVCGFIIC